MNKEVIDINKLKTDYYRISKDMQIDQELEQEMEKQIKLRNVIGKGSKNISQGSLSRLISLTLRKLIIHSQKKEELASKWEEILAYFLEKYGIEAYIKKDNENKDVKFLFGNDIKTISKPIELDEKARLDLFRGKIEIIKSCSYRIPSDTKIDPNLEKLVIESAEYSDDKIVYAYNIYVSLNKIFTFSPLMIALDQNLNNPKIKELYNKEIRSFNESDNEISCKNWSEIYAYFIEKYIGEEAYINDEGKHKKVITGIDGIIVTADATNVTISENETHSFTDLTRAKLGIRPSGFTTNQFVLSIDKKMQEYYQLDDESIISEYKNYDEKESVDDLMNLLGNKNLVDDILNLPPEDNLRNIFRKLKFLSDIAISENMPNTDTLRYLCVLKNILLNEKENDRVTIENSLYTEYEDSQECNIVPLFTIDVDDSNFHTSMYMYLLYDSKKGLCRITEKGICDLVVLNKLKLIENKRKIPGINDIYIDEELEEYKKQMLIRSTKNKRLELKEDGDTQFDDQGDGER